MDQNIKSAVDRLWAKLELPTAPLPPAAPPAPPARTPVQAQVDRMWEMFGLSTPAPEEETTAPVEAETPAALEIVPEPVSRIIGHVPTRLCANEACRREFVLHKGKEHHRWCQDCSRAYIKARAEKAQEVKAPEPKRCPDDQLRERLIDQYKKGELVEGLGFRRSGAQVTLLGLGYDRRGKSSVKSFTYFDREEAERIQASKTAAARANAKVNMKSPEQLRKEKLEAAKREAQNLRVSADAATEKAKSLTAAETAAKLRLEAEPNSEPALEAYCAAEDAARRAWNEAESLEINAAAAERQLANIVNPPIESGSAKKNGKEDKKNGSNGKSRDRHAN